MAVINITAQDLRELIKNKKDNLEIIDIRQPEEYKIIHIKNSKLIPMNELPNRLNEISWDKEVVFFCQSGSRSGFMSNIIAARENKEIKNLKNGIYECYKEWGGEDLEIDEKEVKNYF